MSAAIVQNEGIEDRIFTIRGQKVMIDYDLARLFGVKTKQLNRQVKRNIERFPDEFIFQLTVNEKNELVTNWHQFEKLKHSSITPFAFTEHGVAMLATVLKSDKAVRMSINIIKTFVRIRKFMSIHSEMSKRLDQLDKRSLKHDSDIRELVRDIRRLSIQPSKVKRIGFLK